MKKLTLISAIVLFTNLLLPKSFAQASTSEESNQVIIFNMDNPADKMEFQSLKLDEKYPNLLDPAVSGNDHKEVIESWGLLHQNIGEFLRDNDFDWGVGDASISIVQRIYFDASGSFEYYLFKVFNEDVSMETKDQFAKLLAKYAKTNRIDLSRETQFAQCGKTRY